MSKTKTLNIINSVNDIITMGKERGALMQYTEDESYDGRIITVNGKQLINFGSCSYLGLDTDERIKEAAIDAIRRYGVQFSSSRTYMACTLYKEWEELVSKMFGAHVVLSTSVSLGHHAVIPVVVEEGDAIILDQQVHASIQEAANRMQLRGCSISIIRHSKLNELESKIAELSVKHNRVWYMIDGVYSMYGDYAPVKEIVELLERYPQFHLYADDAHGMSIAGKNGTGIVLSQIELHPKMILATSLNKAFAAGGGAFIFPDDELAQKVKNCGGSMIFSGPHQIPSIAAGIASAKIHLSDEIYERQAALKKRLQYCHDLLSNKYHLPVISNPEAPITFIGLGLTRVGYNMVTRLIEDGFYTNLSIFPAVPETCTGLRFTITLHHTFEDIERLAERIAYHFPKALEDEGRTIKDVHRAFKKVATFEELVEAVPAGSGNCAFQVQYETSIQAIPEQLWNSLLKDKISLDWNGLRLMENSFTANEQIEHNWKFHYFLVRDQNHVPVLATFFTEFLAKDDMLAPVEVSKQIEQLRLNDPYYLCSSMLMMGSLMTLGNHLYIDRSRSDWKRALSLLLDTVWQLQEKNKIATLNMRDFDTDDIELIRFFMDQGFVKIDLPEMFVLEEFHWENPEEFFQRFRSKRKYNLKQEVQKLENYYTINIVNAFNERDLDTYYQLYCNVAEKNFLINDFEIPKKALKNIILSPHWEVLELRMKQDNRIVAICCSYKQASTYNFMLVGMDYSYLKEYNVYKQAIWQVITRANNIHSGKINLGLTASESKRKFGAKPVGQVAFIQTQDHFNVSVINAIPNTSKNN